MTRFLDTSIVVRYLVGDPPDQAKRAQALIEGSDPLHLTSVVVLEAYHCLVSLYGVPRDAAIDALIDLIQRHNIMTPDAEKAHLVTGLGYCYGSGRVSCGDALIWASARSQSPAGEPPARVYTFDKRFPEEEIDRQLV